MDIYPVSRDAVLTTENRAKSFYFKRLLSLVNTVFLWENLPDGMTSSFIENTLLIDGRGAFTDIDDYTFLHIAEENQPGKYYYNNQYLYTNPYLPANMNSGTLYDDKNCIVVYNDSVSRWTPYVIRDFISEYAELLAAVDVSLRIAIRNTRLTYIGRVNNHAELESFRVMQKGVEEGKPASAVLSNTALSDGFTTLPTLTHGVDYLRQITENREYLMNCFLSAFGIRANTVLKRERQLTDELDMQKERPIFSIYGMYNERQNAVDKINSKYNLNISISLNPAITLSTDNDDNAIPDEMEKVGEASVQDI